MAGMTFLEASQWFADKAAEVSEVTEEMVLTSAAIVEKEAKDSLGTYQNAAGPFRAWAPLSDYTQAERARAGFTPDEPLLMSGHLKDSIHTVPIGENAAAVGTNVDYAKDLEYGTTMIPPRPFIGRAGWVKQDEILELQAEYLRAILDI